MWERFSKPSLWEKNGCCLEQHFDIHRTLVNSSPAVDEYHIYLPIIIV